MSAQFAEHRGVDVLETCKALGLNVDKQVVEAAEASHAAAKSSETARCLQSNVAARSTFRIAGTNLHAPSGTSCGLACGN